jgi:hypothetical protein
MYSDRPSYRRAFIVVYVSKNFNTVFQDFSFGTNRSTGVRVTLTDGPARFGPHLGCNRNAFDLKNTSLA